MYALEKQVNIKNMNQYTSDKEIKIVALGASAGGLHPLEAFFKSVSEDTTAIFVVIQHLAPDHKSMMGDLLRRATSIPVEVIEDGTQPVPGNIYLNPPAKTVTISEEGFHLADKKRESLTYPITTFFESMARTFQDHCCAIVLSGTGSDGSEGLKRVRENGGYTLVQDPREAKFDGMPNSAIHTKMVDQVLPVNEMYQSVQLMIDHELEPEKFDEQRNISTILGIVNDKTGIDFNGYKRSTILRRIVRRMKVAGFQEFDSYISFLKENADEAATMADELLIGVTQFFRDWDSYQVVRKKVLPELFEQALQHESRKVRVWVPACSTGEEAYSMAMLLDDYARNYDVTFDITVFATDLDSGAIKEAGARTFATSISKDIPEILLKRYFIAQKNGYKIAREIRGMVIFSEHNLLKEAPFSKIDLISCRNLLIYLNSETQQKVLSLFQYALRSDGYLFLGGSETISNRKKHFKEIDSNARIYLNTTKRAYLDEPKFKKIRHDINKAKELKTNTSSVPAGAAVDKDQFNEALLHQFVPDSVIIDENFRVLHTAGDARKYLSVPLGNMTDSLLKMIPSEWSVPLEVAVDKVRNEETAAKLEDLPLEKAGGDQSESRSVDITVRRLPLSKVSAPVFMINITARAERKVTNDSPVETIALTPETTSKVSSLERELEISRENLQATIEELESSNEELQASNEELQSSNEELESVNEELHTVNAEYEEKVKELSRANNDLKNLLNSTQLAILFLDEKLNIRRFTDSIKQILNIDERDIGRNLNNFASKLPLQKVMEKAETVQEKLVPYETPVSDDNGQAYIIRITPFRTINDEIKGVVLSFVDISELRSVKGKLKDSKEDLKRIREDYDQQHELFRLIANNASDVVGIHEMDGCYTFVSPSSADILGYEPDELIGSSPLEYFHPDDLARLKKRYSGGLKSLESDRPIEFRFKTKWGHYIWLETTIRHISDKVGDSVKILSSTRNISDRVDRIDELRLLSSIVENAHESIMITNEKIQIEYVNAAFSEMTGYQSREILGQKPQDFLYGEESDPHTMALIRSKLANERMFEVEVLNYRKDGSTFWNSITCKPLFKQDGTLRGYFAIQTDVTSEKLHQEQVQQFTQQLEEQNKKLTRVNEDLQEFAYIASHDLKEPVRAIIGVLDLVEQSIDAKGRDAELLTKAADRARRMDTMINSLLQYSRSGEVSEDLEEVALSETLDLVKENLAESIESTDANIVQKGDDLNIRVYPTMFIRLVQNLISNSIKYRKEDIAPEIEVSAVPADEKEGIILKIKDNGIGISDEYRKEIFKLFRRGSQSVEHDSNGLGLAISKRIVEHHNGEIWVESEVGKGSMFYVRLNL